MDDESPSPGIADELIAAFVRLAKGDFTVRLARNYRRDTADTLAFFVNLIAEELARLLEERERSHRELEDGVTRLSEAFLSLAAGDFSVRVSRSERGDPVDVLAYLFNNMAAEVGDAFEQLEKQRSMLEAILESMLDGVLLLDAQGSIRRANGAIARLLGHDSADLLDRPLSSILDRAEHPFASNLPAAVERAPLRDRTTLFLSAQGESIPVAVNGSAQHDADGELVGIVLVARDDRELKQAQAQLQLTDRLATMGTLAAGVAHEINNPLSFVIGNLEYIEEELSDPGDMSEDDREELVRAAKSSLGGADRVRQIVRDLKTFSRVDEDVRGPIDLNALVESSLHMIRNEIRHHARIVKELGEAPAVEANAGRLGQVLLNLLQNAAHAIPLGKAEANEIRIVSGANPAGEAFVEIHDTGTGIESKHRSRIFDAFYTTKPVGFGTGLGLSISHKIVSSLGGRIEVESTVGEGSMFRVVLPAVPPAAERAGPGAPPAARTEPARCRVLVVDDEPEIGDMVRRMLGKDHDVEAVTRAAEALERIEHADYDVILCDVLMPEMTGMELFARLSTERPELVRRVAFMTGGAFSTHAREFLRKVSNPKIEKPFDADRLRMMIAEVCSATS